jgi:hypothetical protein
MERIKTKENSEEYCLTHTISNGKIWHGETLTFMKTLWETPTWRFCFERLGQRPCPALWQSVRSSHQAPANFREFPPPEESRQSYTSLTTSTTPCAVRTPLCPVWYTRTERVQCVTPNVGEVFAHRYLPQH